MDAQADLRLCCLHMAKTGFVMMRLIFNNEKLEFNVFITYFKSFIYEFAFSNKLLHSFILHAPV